MEDKILLIKNKLVAIKMFLKIKTDYNYNFMILRLLTFWAHTFHSVLDALFNVRKSVRGLVSFQHFLTPAV